MAGLNPTLPFSWLKLDDDISMQIFEADGVFYPSSGFTSQISMGDL